MLRYADPLVPGDDSPEKIQLPSPSGSGVVSGQNFIRVAKLCRKIINPTDFVLFLCSSY